MLRNITQIGSGYTQASYGFNATLRLLNNSLILSGMMMGSYYHDGEPFNQDKSKLNFTIYAQYYIKNWSLTAHYSSDSLSSNGPLTGQWTSNPDNYGISVGWANNNWQLSGNISNFFRWNWRDTTTKMNSRYLDTNTISYTPNSHCFVQLSATYIFGFGKEIKRGDEASQQSGATSAILK